MAKTKQARKATAAASTPEVLPDYRNPNGSLFFGQICHKADNHILIRLNNGHNFSVSVHPTETQMAVLAKGDRIAVRGFIREHQGEGRMFINLNGKTELRSNGRYQFPATLAVKAATGKYVELVPTSEEAEGTLISNVHTAIEDVTI